MRRNASSVSSTEEMRLAFTAGEASRAVAKSAEKVRDAALAAAVAIAAPKNSRRVGVIDVILLECAWTVRGWTPGYFTGKRSMVSSGRSEYHKEGLRTMRRLFAMCGALLLAAWITPAQQGLTLQVQIHYTGSGTVDETHKIFVALWDSASFTDADGGPPVAVQSTSSKNQ